MTAYNTRPFIDPIPRAPGWYDAHCHVSWHPRGGEPTVVTGAYLDAHAPDGAVSLGCGVEEAADDVGMGDWLAEAADDELTGLCDLVTTQLAERSWAEVKCPLGMVRIGLVPAWC